MSFLLECTHLCIRFNASSRKMFGLGERSLLMTEKGYEIGIIPLVVFHMLSLLRADLIFNPPFL